MRIPHLLLAAFLTSCATAPDAPPAAAPTLTVTLSNTAQGGTGPLILWYDTAAERDAGGGAAIRNQLIRAHVVPDVTLGPGAALRIPLPDAPRDATLRWHAIHDTRVAYWNTVLGGQTGNATGSTEDASTSLTLQEGPLPEPRDEPCSGDGLELLIVDVPAVKGIVGNNTQRRLCVSTPKTLRPDGRHPVVFLLPGLGSDHMSRLRGNSDLRPVRDEVFNEAILVGVDGRIRMGSTYFTATDVNGDWNTFLDTMVAAVDEKYPTARTPSSRALIGQSTGGFNAIAVAIRRPDLFGAAAASAPDALHMKTWLIDVDRPTHMAPTWWAWMRLEHRISRPVDDTAPLNWGQMLSYGADFSPDKGATPPMRWPADLDTRELVDDVVEQWHAQSPAGMLEDDAIRARTKAKLDGKMFISVGRNDEFDLFPPAERFHRDLEAYGIQHVWQPTDEGHFKSMDRLKAGMAFLQRAMRADQETP